MEGSEKPVPGCTVEEKGGLVEEGLQVAWGGGLGVVLGGGLEEDGLELLAPPNESLEPVLKDRLSDLRYSSRANMQVF